MLNEINETGNRNNGNPIMIDQLPLHRKQVPRQPADHRSYHYSVFHQQRASLAAEGGSGGR
jgi:hypothetical protein